MAYRKLGWVGGAVAVPLTTYYGWVYYNVSNKTKDLDLGGRYSTLDAYFKSLVDCVPAKAALSLSGAFSQVFNPRSFLKVFESTRASDLPSAQHTFKEEESFTANDPPPLRCELRLNATKDTCALEKRLGDDERAALASLKARWAVVASTELEPPLTYLERLEYTDVDLLRFLRARDHNVPAALTLLSSDVKYRRASGLTLPQLGLPVDKLEEYNGREGAMYRRGFDVEGRPIVVIRPKNTNLALPAETAALHFASIISRAVLSMGVGVEELDILVDYNGYLVQHQPSLLVATTVLGVLSNHFPERLNVVYVLDAPWYLHVFKTLVWPFIPSRTARKVKFVSTHYASRELQQLCELIPEESREQWCNKGAIGPPYYQPCMYWEAERRYQQQLEAFIDQIIAAE